MKVLEKLEAWFAVALVLFFFLPWVNASIAGISIAGVNIPGVSESGSGFNLGSTSGGIGSLLLFSSWLVLIMSIATIVMAAMGRDTRTIGLATGIVAVVVIVYLFIWCLANSSSQPPVPVTYSLSFGAYLTLLAGIGMIVAALGIIKSPVRAPAPPVPTV